MGSGTDELRPSCGPGRLLSSVTSTPWPSTHHPQSSAASGSANSAAPCPTSLASTSSATPAGASSTSARRSRSASASPATSPTRRSYGTTALTEEIDHIEYLVVVTEAEALLTEQNFIKQYKPKFNIRLRDDKSYPYIAISLDEDFPRVYFTREKHKRERAYFGPYSSAKRVRGTLDLLGKIFLFRSCEGTEPGRHSGSPCLDYYIKRCGAPCVGYVSKEEYREGIDGVVAFLSGRFKQIERDLERKMYFAAGERDYEQATIERNRLQAVKSLLERQRVSEGGAGTYDAVAVAVEGTEANAQVFQVRDGVLSDRQSFYLENQAEQEPAIVAEEFMLQYYASALSIPPLIVVAGHAGRRAPSSTCWARSWPSAAAARSRSAPSERGGKRRILDLARAQRAARARPGEAQGRAPPPAARGLADRASRPRLALDTLPVRIECFDISHVGGTHTVASMVVFEGGAPKKSDYRRFTIREVDTGDDFAAMAEVLTRRYAQWEKPGRALALRRRARRVVRRAAEPRGHRRRQGPARAPGLEPLQGFRERGVAVVSLAKRIEEVFLPGDAEPDRAAARHAGAAARCSASATRRIASPSPTTGSAATRR